MEFCKMTTIVDADSDEEWDLIEDFKRLTPLPALETELDKEISDDGDVENSEGVDDFLETEDEEMSDAEEWEFLYDFMSLIPLPPEFALETAKSEEVLFENEANIYKFVDGKWKEENLCIVKILHNSFEETVRLLMRRKEVPEVCANHYITPDMKIHPSTNLDQALTWDAQEFVDEKLKPENFCIRFKDAELAAAFEAAFIKAVNIAYASIEDDLSNSEDEAFDSHVASELTSKAWFCPYCKTTNGADKIFCFVCKSTRGCRFDTRTGKHLCHIKSDSYDSRTNISRCLRVSKPDYWCCPLCETTNVADKYYCVVCETSQQHLLD